MIVWNQGSRSLFQNGKDCFGELLNN